MHVCTRVALTHGQDWTFPSCFIRCLRCVWSSCLCVACKSRSISSSSRCRHGCGWPLFHSFTQTPSQTHNWKLAPDPDAALASAAGEVSLQPPLSLLRHPPLALFANDMLDALVRSSCFAVIDL